MEDDDVYDIVPETSAEKSAGLSSLINRFNKDPVMVAAMATKSKPVLKPKPTGQGSVPRQPKPQPSLPPKTGSAKGKPPPVLPKNAVKLPDMDFHKGLLHSPRSPNVTSPTVKSKGNEIKPGPVSPHPTSNGFSNEMVSTATAPPAVTRGKENKPVPELPVSPTSPTAKTTKGLSNSTVPPVLTRSKERKPVPEPPPRTTPELKPKGEKPAVHIKIGRDGLRYQLLPCPMVTGPPPKKPARPADVVMPKLGAVDEYAEDDELYDEVGVDSTPVEVESTPTGKRPVSIIPEYTEEEESEEIKQQKVKFGIPLPDAPTEEVYDDTDSRPLPLRPPTIDGEELYDDLDSEMPPPLPPPYMPGEEVYDDVDSDMPPPPVPPHLPERNPPVKKKEVEKEEEVEEVYDDIGNTEEEGEALYETFEEVVDTGL